ncbi:MAG: phosphate ABC transporter substrate-binding protein PstS [Pseudonocardiaceae bacterium]
MKLKLHGAALALVATTALTLTACGSNPNAGSGGGPSASGPPVKCGGKNNLNGEGSSAQKNAMDAFIQAYQQRCSGQNVAYNPTGSGSGVKQFTAGLVDFGGSDSPLVAADQVAAATKRCQDHPAWNLPLVFGPVALGYHLNGVTNLVLNAETTAKIFNGKITSWNDAAITALNPGVSLPATPIRVIFRSDESGTTDNFQLYLQTASKGAWTQGAGKSFKGGVGSGAEKSAGVAQATNSTDGAITYVELSFAQDNKLSIAKIDTGSGPVELNGQSVGKAIDAAKIKGEGNNLVLDLNSIYGSTEAGAYPLILATYELVCSQGYAPDVAQAVKAFLTVAATDGQANLADAGYAPLPEAFQKKILAAVEAISPQA